MSETIGIYAVYDMKGERYDTPYFSLDDLNAERKFVFNFENNNTIFSRFKNDFSLKKIGIFNVINGEITPLNKLIREGKQLGQRKVREVSDEISDEA